MAQCLEALVNRQCHCDQSKCDEFEGDDMHQIHADVVVPKQDDLLNRVHVAGVVHQEDEVGNRRKIRHRDVQRPIPPALCIPVLPRLRAST